MKKKLYVVLALLVAFSTVMVNSHVAAESIITKIVGIPNVYADFTLQNGSVHATELAYIYAGDKLTYCVEPILYIGAGEPLVPSTSLDEAMREKLSIISYNGYNKTNRHSDKWYMATQIMIWEALGYAPKVRGFNDYSSYKKQIQQNIETYQKLPSFSGTKLTLEQGKEVVLEDHNQVLSLFQNVILQGKAKMQRKGDALSLLVESNQYEEGKIQIEKFTKDQLGLPIVYRSPNDDTVQEIMYPHISQNVQGELEYRVQPYGYVKLNKTGEVLSHVDVKETSFGKVYEPQYRKGSLSGVKVGIYAREDIKDAWGNLKIAKNTLIDTLISGEKETSNKLMAGSYYLKEIASIDGYVMDQKEYDFVISKENEVLTTKEIEINNLRSKVDILLHKTLEEGSLLDLSEAYQDIVFGIYTKDAIYDSHKNLLVPQDELVYLSNITKEGYLEEMVDLPLGNYYLKELATNEHFVLDERVYEFEIKANGEERIPVQIGSGELVNQLHRNHLRILKVDGKDQTPLSATFVLYDQNKNEIQRFTTNEEGYYEFDDLVDGTYYLQEVESAKGYKLDNQIREIKLNEDLEIEIENEKIPEPKKKHVDTNDTQNHKPLEVSMLASMSVMYGFVLRKLRK